MINDNDYNAMIEKARRMVKQNESCLRGYYGNNFIAIRDGVIAGYSGNELDLKMKLAHSNELESVVIDTIDGFLEKNS